MQKSYAELKVARLATEDGIGPLVGYGCFWLVAEEMQIIWWRPWHLIN